METSTTMHSTFRSFLWLLRQSNSERGAYGLLIATSLLSTVLGLGIVEATRRIITGAAEQSLAPIYSGLIIGLAAVAAQFINQLVITWLKATVDNRATTRLQLKLLRKVATQHGMKIEQYHSSELYGRITDSVAEAQSGLNDKLIRLVTNLVQLLVSFTYFSWLNLPLALGMVGFAVAFPLLVYPLTGRLNRHHARRHEEMANSDILLQDAIQGGLNVRALSIRGLLLNKFTNKIETVRKRNTAIAAYDGMFDFANRGLMYGGMLFILGFGGYQVLRGSLTVGGLTAFVAASGKLTGPLRSIAGMWNELIASLSHTSRFAKLLDWPEEVTDGYSSPATLDPAGVTIQVSQLSYGYEGKPSVLNEIDMKINQGELTVILGKSGCGKSTLLRLLAKLDEPASGRIETNQSSLEEQSAQAWHAKIGYVPQASLLFTGTIRDNICFGKLDATQADIEQAAIIAQIHDRIMQLPNTYETTIREKEDNMLSGGELQRMALARAIVRNPALLLLDEPTASLDPITESQLMSALHQFRSKKTVVLVTHKLSIAQQADQIIVLEDGMVAESGSHAQLISLGGRYCAWTSENEVGEVNSFACVHIGNPFVH
ncbi:ABC transporter ATP-binding protein [Paenibacillus sp. PR3]|uniref:ABC transporter ATP-binding protein n=1 Tax=Paenibacillus terricola TaxID=2763503 RepID=A0ABR8N0M7_9BACL|nr:ABC transporter ATP-binding protein [Paenibacillus terricola]MBD3921091.1 ABC transporter ATP-binding protein [Paenibacillus terricola]